MFLHFLLLLATCSWAHAQIRGSLNTVNNNCPPYPKPIDCAEVLRNGNRYSGVYTIFPLNRVMQCGSLQVYCDMDTDGGGWTVIQRRGDYKRNETYFFKGWEDYKKGFGLLLKDFWLGNDNIYALTNQRLYSARFDLKPFNQNKRYALYDSFWIENEKLKYQLHIRDYSGEAGDAMSIVDGMFFSTKDRKHSMNDCANDYKGAWWYNNCHEANLNGLYLKGNTTEYAKGVVWKHLAGHYHSLELSEIKIRPADFKK